MRNYDFFVKNLKNFCNETEVISYLCENMKVNYEKLV